MSRLSFLEVFRDKTGGNTKLQTSAYQNHGRFPIIDQGRDAVAGYTDREDAVASVDLPVIIFGDHTRAIKYVDQPFVLGADGAKVLSPRRDGDARFLFHYLRSVELPSAGYSRHFKYLKEITVPFPAHDEQRRIAAILDKADELRAKRRQAIAHLDALTQSIFHSMFGQHLLDMTMTVGSTGRVQLGRQRAPKYQTGAHSRQYMRVANVKLNYIDLDDVLSMDFDPRDFAAYRLNYGDILLNEGQSTELVGRPAIWRDEVVDCCFQNTLVRYVANPQWILPEFALATFLYYFSRGEFAKISSKTSSIAHLGATRFARMPMPTPPLELQQTFATRVAAVERLKETHRKHLKQLDALFASLQSRAFKGEL